jgi:hypothetical protein
MDVDGYRFSISSAHVFKFDPSKSHITTALAPLAANVTAVARPIPRSELHPVMIATLSLSRVLGVVDA